MKRMIMSLEPRWPAMVLAVVSGIVCAWFMGTGWRCDLDAGKEPPDMLWWLGLGLLWLFPFGLATWSRRLWVWTSLGVWGGFAATGHALTISQVQHPLWGAWLVFSIFLLTPCLLGGLAGFLLAGVVCRRIMPEASD